MDPRALRSILVAPLRVLLAGLAALMVAFAAAAEAPSEAVIEVAARDASATVRVENRVIFTFRARLGMFTPAERAEAATLRVRQIAERGGPLVVSVDRQPEGNFVRIDGLPAFMILPGDINPLLDENLEDLTRHTVEALEASAAAYRERRSPAAIAWSIVYALVATLVFAAVVWGLAKGRRALTRHIARGVEGAVGRTKSRLGGLLNPHALGSFGAVLASLVAWALMLGAAYAWLTFVLSRFPYTRPWGLQLSDHLIGTLASMGLAAAEAAPGLLVVAIIVLITRSASRVTRAFFDRIEAGRIELGQIDAFTAPMTRRLVTAVLWLFALAMAYPYLPGAQTEAFKGVSVLAGLMVSLGASSVVGQAASGLILTYSHAFKPGEYVRIGDVEGTLSSIGMFATRIETGLGELVVLPNNVVLAQTTKNYSRTIPGAGFVLDTTVTIGYATPWRQVHAMLKEAAARTAGIASQPAPVVAQMELSDFYPAYRLICYAEPQQPRKRAALLSDLHAHIQDVFNEYGVQIMSPHYMADPPQAQVVPKERWFDAPAQRDEGTSRAG